MIVEKKTSSSQNLRRKKFRRKKQQVRKKPKIKKTKTARLRETYIKEQMRIQNDWEIVSDPYWFNYLQKLMKKERSKYVDYSSSRFRISYNTKRKKPYGPRSRQKSVTLLKIPEIALTDRGVSDQEIAAGLLPVVTQFLQEQMKSKDIIKIDPAQKLHLKQRVLKKMRKHWPVNKTAEPAHIDFESICYERSVTPLEIFKSQLSPDSRKDNSSIESYESRRGFQEAPRKFGIGASLNRLKKEKDADMKPTVQPVWRSTAKKSSKPSVKTETVDSKDLLKGQGDHKLEDKTKLGRKTKCVEKPDKKPVALPSVNDLKMTLRPPPIEAGVQTTITCNDMEKIMECKCKKIVPTAQKKLQEPRKFKWKL